MKINWTDGKRQDESNALLHERAPLSEVEKVKQPSRHIARDNQHEREYRKPQQGGKYILHGVVVKHARLHPYPPWYGKQATTPPRPKRRQRSG